MKLNLLKKIGAFIASGVLALGVLGGSSYAALEDGTYNVPVTLKKAVEDADSMGAKALEPEAKVVVQGGKPKITLYFKGLSFMNMYGHILKLYTYPQGTDLTSSSKSPQEVPVSENFMDKGLDNTEKEFPRAFTFERESTDETAIPVRVLVDAMAGIASDGKGEQDARVMMDYAAAKKSDGSTPAADKDGAGSSSSSGSTSSTSSSNSSNSSSTGSSSGSSTSSGSSSSSTSGKSSSSTGSSDAQKSSSQNSSAPDSLPKTGSLVNARGLALLSAVLLGLGLLIGKKVR